MKSLALRKWISMLLVIAMISSFPVLSFAEETPLPEVPFTDVPAGEIPSGEVYFTEAPIEETPIAPVEETPIAPVEEPIDAAPQEEAESPSPDDIPPADSSVEEALHPESITPDSELVSLSEGSEPLPEDVPQNLDEPSQSEVPSDSEVPADSQSDIPASESSVAESASASPVAGEESLSSASSDPAKTTEEVEPDSEAESEESDSFPDPRTMITFVSPQDITFTLYDSLCGPVLSATEEEISEYLSGISTAEMAADITSFPDLALVTDSPVSEEGEVIFRAVYLLSPGYYYYSASAEGYRPLEDVLLEIREEAADETISLPLEKALPFGLKGMPEGYQLSAEDLLSKQKLIDHDVVSALSTLIPGVDYVDNEVYFLAESEEYARSVAEAYSADLVSCSDGVAVLWLNTATVLEAVTAAADPEIPIPVVSPNYITSVYPINEMGREAAYFSSGMSVNDIPQLQSWKSWHDAAASNADPFLNDPLSANYQFMHDVVNSYEAWGFEGKNYPVKVAVIDSGVEPGLPDLPNVTFSDPSFVPADGFVYDSWLYPHGTHVAGIIAASLENSEGGAGIAPMANIVSIRVLDSRNSGSHEIITRGIDKAINAGVDIINMSIGGFFYDPSYEAKIQEAINNGITVVASMGNQGSNIKQYPAAFNIPGLIAVQSTTEGGNLSSFTNTGPWADVSAPGSKIISTFTSNPEGYKYVESLKDLQYDFNYMSSGAGIYGWMSGTSMAAPVVSGVCALYMHAFGNPGPSAMEQIIKSATTNGIIDASKLFTSGIGAKKAKVAPSIDFNSDPETSILPYDSNYITFSCPAIESDDVFFLYTLDGKDPSIKDGQVVNGIVYEGPIAVNVENGFIPGTKLTLKAVYVNGMGELSDVASSSFTVGYANPTDIIISGYPVEQTLASGKSITLSAVVEPAEANQDVIWSISDSNGCSASINPKTGVLKSSATDNGWIKIAATSKDNHDVSNVCNFYIKPAIPTEQTKKIVLKDSNNNTVSSVVISNDDLAILYAEARNINDITIEDTYFSWSSSNSKVATVDEYGVITAVSKGKTTITCKATDGSNVSAKCNVTVKQLVESISISGPQYIVPGKSAAFKAAVLPSNADNKKLEWSVRSEDGSSISGVSVNSSGKVTVSSSAVSGNYVLSAKALDGSDTKEEFSFELQDLVTSISLDFINCYDEVTGVQSWFYGANNVKYSKDSLTEAVLYSVDIDNSINEYNEKRVDASLQLLATVTGPRNAVNLEWSSSKPSVATVDETGFVRAVSAGTATVTCKALDTSGKKASVKITVINPASSVTVISSSSASLSGDNSNRYADEKTSILGIGKAVSNKAVLGDAFGKPSITKVTWSCYISIEDFNGINTTDELNLICDSLLSQKCININKSGSVSAKAKLKSPVYVKTYNDAGSIITVPVNDLNVLTSLLSIYVDVYAQTTDNTGLYGSARYSVSPLHKSLITYTYLSDYNEEYSGPNVKISRKLDQNRSFSSYIFETGDVPFYWYNYTVKSSNPDIVGAYTNGRFLYFITGTKSGTAKLTITATDGSNKKCTLTVKVK